MLTVWGDVKFLILIMTGGSTLSHRMDSDFDIFHALLVEIHQMSA